MAFHLLVDLENALADQEQTAAQENQVTHRDAIYFFMSCQPCLGNPQI